MESPNFFLNQLSCPQISGAPNTPPEASPFWPFSNLGSSRIIFWEKIHYWKIFQPKDQHIQRSKSQILKLLKKSEQVDLYIIPSFYSVQKVIQKWIQWQHLETLITKFLGLEVNLYPWMCNPGIYKTPRAIQNSKNSLDSYGINPNSQVHIVYQFHCAKWLHC